MWQENSMVFFFFCSRAHAVCLILRDISTIAVIFLFLPLFTPWRSSKQKIRYYVNTRPLHFPNQYRVLPVIVTWQGNKLAYFKQRNFISGENIDVVIPIANPNHDFISSRILFALEYISNIWYTRATVVGSEWVKINILECKLLWKWFF